MKKVYKMIFVFGLLFLIVGCGEKATVRSAVNEFFNRYNTLDAVIMDQLNSYVKGEDLNDSQEEVYKEILRREYTNLEYEIVKEENVDDENIVYVKIWVYDLYKAQKEALDYYNDHKDEFTDNEGNYDKVKFMDYKLEQMKKMMDKKEYELELRVVKDDDGYRVKQLTNEELEKIHGIYNYEE